MFKISSSDGYSSSSMLLSYQVMLSAAVAPSKAGMSGVESPLFLQSSLLPQQACPLFESQLFLQSSLLPQQACPLFESQLFLQSSLPQQASPIFESSRCSHHPKQASPLFLQSPLLPKQACPLFMTPQLNFEWCLQTYPRRWVSEYVKRLTTLEDFPWSRWLHYTRMNNYNSSQKFLLDNFWGSIYAMNLESMMRTLLLLIIIFFN